MWNKIAFMLSIITLLIIIGISCLQPDEGSTNEDYETPFCDGNNSVLLCDDFESYEKGHQLKEAGWEFVDIVNNKIEINEENNNKYLEIVSVSLEYPGPGVVWEFDAEIDQKTILTTVDLKNPGRMFRFHYLASNDEFIAGFHVEEDKVQYQDKICGNLNESEWNRVKLIADFNENQFSITVNEKKMECYGLKLPEDEEEDNGAYYEINKLYIGWTNYLSGGGQADIDNIKVTCENCMK